MPTKEFLTTFTQAWNDGDVDALMNHFHEECSFFTSVGLGMEGTKCVGREEVRRGCESLYEGYPDAHFEAVGEDFFSGDRGCSEWIFSGTRKTDGKKVKVRGCDVYTFREGKISLKNSMRKQEP